MARSTSRRRGRRQKQRGDSRYGGDSGAVAAQIGGALDVTQLFSTVSAFAAWRSNGSLEPLAKLVLQG
jgi:hypothetical protein